MATQAKRSARKPAKKATKKAVAPDAIRLLRDDHAEVRGLLAELVATTARGMKTRGELLGRIARALDAHAAIEEQIFYPAFKAAGRKGDDDRMYFEAIEEHRAALDLVLPDLLATDAGSECFGGRAKVLKELVEHHAREEEREMFPRARVLLSAEALRDLGVRMQLRKAEVLARADGTAEPKSAVARVIDKVVEAIAPGGDEATAPEDEPVPGQARKATGNGTGARSHR